jgi:hypothetical protein
LQLNVRHSPQAFARNHDGLISSHQSNLPPDTQSRLRMIARDHNDLNPGASAPLDRSRHFRPRRIVQPHESQQSQLLLNRPPVAIARHVAGRYSEDAQALMRHLVLRFREAPFGVFRRRRLPTARDDMRTQWHEGLQRALRVENQTLRRVI